MKIVKNRTILISMHCHQLHLPIDYNSENKRYLRSNNGVFPSDMKSDFRFDFKNFTLLQSKSSRNQSTTIYCFTLFRENYIIKVENDDFILVRSRLDH